MPSLYQKRVCRLLRQFEGVTDPNQMGTTGLCAWVAVAHGLTLYHRFRKARVIIRNRFGEAAVPRFFAAVERACPSAERRAAIMRYITPKQAAD